jgi:hypothetical protein
MVLGLRMAVDRFKAAARGWDPIAAALPLFESLNWAVALDERIRKDWMPDGSPPIGWDWPKRIGNEADAEAVRGIRFIRNRVHHQWADALTLAGPGNRYPARPFEWVWATSDQLPPHDAGHRDRGREDYEKLLEGQPAEVGLAILLETYDFMTQLLEPLGPPPEWRRTAEAE